MKPVRLALLLALGISAGFAADPSTSSPLQFSIGEAKVTPIGFMDFSTIIRSTNPGSGLGTNFGSVPYTNVVTGNIGEMRFTSQNSRIGLRVDADFHGAKVLGYMEADFLGSAPSNVAVSSNGNVMRMRVYFMDAKMKKWEILGGQSWSMLTPGRKGISPIPGDLFYTQNIDANYQAGLAWTRAPQFRIVYHPSSAVAFGLSFENPEQYIGGSGGGGTSVLPSALTSIYASQLDNGSTTLTAPNMIPDTIAKIAIDGKRVHVEAAGMVREFRTYNSLTNQHLTGTGAAGSFNAIVEVAKNLKVVSANYWSNGGGRYLFGLAPDVVVKGDGTPAPLHSGSTVDGIEYTYGRTQIGVYGSAVYVGRNTVIDPSTGKLVGYGYAGSAASQNRLIREATFDLNRTIWKDAKYGALNVMFQYSYLTRNPWVVASNAPSSARVHMAFLNLRYTLPGSAPSAK